MRPDAARPMTTEQYGVLLPLALLPPSLSVERTLLPLAVEDSLMPPTVEHSLLP